MDSILSRPSWPLTVLLSLQHLSSVFGATVLVPRLFNLPPSTTLFITGLSTILYIIVTKRKIPSFLGSSFAFISPTRSLMAKKGFGYPAAQGK
jgi:uracil permease